MTYYLVAVNLPDITGLGRNFTYHTELISEEWQQQDLTNLLVIVPFGHRQRQLGLVLKVQTEQEIAPNILPLIKSITEVIPATHQPSAADLQCYQWCARYYQYPVAKLIDEVLPDLWSELETKNKSKSNPKPEPKAKQREIITTLAGQGCQPDWPWPRLHQQLLEEICTNLSVEKSTQHLIHGETGSGKTLLLLEVMKHRWAASVSASIANHRPLIVYLVPEINLTQQFVNFFKQYAPVGLKVMLYHGSLSKAQKKALYWSLKSIQQPTLLIASRSAIFLPLEAANLIIIDEEHESSYKQQDHCPYHAREVATVRAHQQQIPIIFASATPCAETYFRFKNTATKETHCYYRLPRKLHQQWEFEQQGSNLTFKTSFSVEVIPVTRSSEQSYPLGVDLVSVLRNFIDAPVQGIIFLNKLGYAGALECSQCQLSLDCPQCSHHLTYFQKRGKLKCQVCEYETTKPKICSQCLGGHFKEIGFGVEKIEEQLKRDLAQLTYLRFDRDELTTPKQIQTVLEQFHRGDASILLGTQMLAKGHNFKRVNTVIVLGLDRMGQAPDFRAREKTYQLLKQVFGRAAREAGVTPQLYVQTKLTPEEFQATYLCSYEDMMSREFMERKKWNYPPYCRLTCLWVMGPLADPVLQLAQGMKDYLEQLVLGKSEGEYTVLGPRLSKSNHPHQEQVWLLLLKAKEAPQMSWWLEQLTSALYDQHYFKQFFKRKKSTSIKIQIDRDPQHMS